MAARWVQQSLPLSGEDGRRPPPLAQCRQVLKAMERFWEWFEDPENDGANFDEVFRRRVLSQMDGALEDLREWYLARMAQLVQDGAVNGVEPEMALEWKVQKRLEQAERQAVARTRRP